MATVIDTWQEVSAYAFLVRWREAFKTQAFMWPQQLKERREFFIRLGVELDVLELDLGLTIDELGMSYQLHYGEPEALARKKFAVVYHTDNFYVRIHKLLENVYGLIALSVGLNLDAKPDPHAPPGRVQLRNALDRRRLVDIESSLFKFESDPFIRQARNARNLFVHRYRDEPNWPVLGPKSRLLEFEDRDETERLIRQELQPAEIDRYADRKAEEFGRMLESARGLRARRYGLYLEEVLANLSKEPAEVRERWKWLVEWGAFIRDLDSDVREAARKRSAGDQDS